MSGGRPLLAPPTKRLRARCIADWCYAAGRYDVVCFTCGNAARALMVYSSLRVLVVGGPEADLTAPRWWSQAEIARVWPGHFDATSGHLPPELMLHISQALLLHCGVLEEEEYDVPTGSGETLVALAMAYPNVAFHAVYSASDPARRFEPAAPLGPLVRRLAASICIDP